MVPTDKPSQPAEADCSVLPDPESYAKYLTAREVTIAFVVFSSRIPGLKCNRLITGV